MPDAIIRFLITPHALRQLKSRGLDPMLIASVVLNPEQRLAVRPGRHVLQSRLEIDAKRYLVRVIVDVDREPAEIVTAYRTSKIAKYWSGER
jgi:hypothetical protein